jgi:SAM-dependent methyltransferase
VEDAPFKTRQILRMLEGHPEISIRTVCDIGAGAGAVLHELQSALPSGVTLVGYEISPQAHALSLSFANSACEFVLGDAFADPRRFDLVLVMDVVEHVEDCFAFMRHVKAKGRYKIYHIPLDLNVNTLLRGVDRWDTVGHLHLFTIETAIKSVEQANQKVLASFLTSGALDRPGTWKCRVANLLRRPIAAMSPIFAARLLGGYSILILAE